MDAATYLECVCLVLAVAGVVFAIALPLGYLAAWANRGGRLWG